MRSSVELVCVDPARIVEFWPHLRPLLKAACQRTKLNAFTDLEDDILAGRSLVWMAWNGRAVEAAVATALVDTEAGRVCVITLCAGHDMRRWLPLLAGIEAYAKAEGCRRLRIFGRKGWLQLLDGFEARHSIMDKELS